MRRRSIAILARHMERMEMQMGITAGATSGPSDPAKGVVLVEPTCLVSRPWVDPQKHI